MIARPIPNDVPAQSLMITAQSLMIGGQKWRIPAALRALNLRI